MAVKSTTPPAPRCSECDADNARHIYHSFMVDLHVFQCRQCESRFCTQRTMLSPHILIHYGGPGAAQAIRESGSWH